ncbi:V-type proton ATPase subunit Vha26 [Dermacentor variabilis]|uniref:V-type proton ATPase subunit Vha26 n=1 Tax=Dermacentor variabilis TaxID=34621 RepID=UPI003F5B9A19
MALSDSDVKKQIKHMMAFIEQEANEKVEEVDAKAEEEFNIEKGRLVAEQRLKIMDYYSRKEKQVELQRKIQSSNMLNQARLKVLKEGEGHIHKVLEEARRHLGDITHDEPRYREVLEKLILQSLLRLLETEVTVCCRPKDKKLIDTDAVARKYHAVTGQTVQLSVEGNLSEGICGGVELVSKRGRIRVCNTLESRLDMIFHQLLPQVRTALFGRNPNRKFSD